MNEGLFLLTMIVATIIIMGTWTYYSIRKSERSMEEREARWEAEREERRRLKKLKEQQEHEALLSISASLEILASRHKASKT